MMLPVSSTPPPLCFGSAILVIRSFCHDGHCPPDSRISVTNGIHVKEISTRQPMYLLRSNSNKLNDEHIIPFGLAGNAYVLKKASCTSCGSITGKVEQACLRRMLGPFRIRVGSPTRNPKERPEKIITSLHKKDRRKRCSGRHEGNSGQRFSSHIPRIKASSSRNFGGLVRL